MKIFEDIRDRFYKSEEDLERDLILYLKYKESGKNPPQHIRGEYQDAIVWILEKCECLNDLVWRREINDKGKKFIKRGWVIRDYATPKRKEWWKETREWATLIIAILACFLGSFLPSQKMVQAAPEVANVNCETIYIVSQNLDSLAQMNKTTKDTCKQDYQKNNN